MAIPPIGRGREEYVCAAWMRAVVKLQDEEWPQCRCSEVCPGVSARITRTWIAEEAVFDVGRVCAQDGCPDLPLLLDGIC